MIQQGVSQDRSLSPLSLNLVFMVMAVYIRSSIEMQELQAWINEYKLNLYADNAFFVLQEPVRPLLRFSAFLKLYGRLSEYAVNAEKSSYMGLNITDEMDGQIM